MVFLVLKFIQLTMKKFNMKIPREIRLAYLCELLYRRLQNGDKAKTTWVRHYKLIRELDFEKSLLNIKGFLTNKKFIKRLL